MQMVRFVADRTTHGAALLALAEIMSPTTSPSIAGAPWAEVAARMGISQPACSQQEAKERLRESSREKIAAALGITADQLDF
uniref:hypothetical protein n=1 Tax=Paraburkholderia sediminicola TaxID=458836 RepID=UPI0038B8E22B